MKTQSNLEATVKQKQKAKAKEKKLTSWPEVEGCVAGSTTQGVYRLTPSVMKDEMQI